MSKKQYFDGVVGQSAAKQRLGFFLDNHIKTGTPFPHLLLTGFRGDGKSHLARKIARNFPCPGDPSKKHKPFFPLNGSSIKSLSVLFNDILSKTQDMDCTVFIDEAHGMPKSVQTAFLTILEPNKYNRTSYTYDDIEYTFDFKRITFIFATTEDDAIFHALKDRLYTIGLQPYSSNELAEIIEMVVDGTCSFEDGVLQDLSRHVRRNARDADRMAKHVLCFGVPVFEKKHLKELKKSLSLFPYGISIDEYRVLEELEKAGSEGKSLGALASFIGRPAKAMQKELEPYLISLGLMIIDGKRIITQKGKDFLAEVSGKKK
jgi:Holliday junction resolvasome RuvABC ATP-dependent DNA helicase subunit